MLTGIYTPDASRGRDCPSALPANVLATLRVDAPPKGPRSRDLARVMRTTVDNALFAPANSTTSAVPALATTQPPLAESHRSKRSVDTVHSCMSPHTHTSVNIAVLGEELIAHPNRDFVSFLLDGLTHGFRIGYSGSRDTLICNNLASAYAQPEIVTDYLAKECALGHTAGPFDVPPFLPFRSAGIGVIPKKSGGHRLIVHLSAPNDQSINDGISKDSYKLQYIGVDDIIRHVARLGKGALMFKVDMKHAFRLIPVHPDDWPLLGMVWRDKFYVDKVLPFGLRSSPSLFNNLAEAVCWILRHNYSMPLLEHYLDDYMNVAPASSNVRTSTAAVQMATLLQVFENLGIPVAVGDDKVVPPTTTMTVLGIEVDSVAQESRLPSDKLACILELLGEWRSRRSATKRELLSLIGHLSFAAKVVPPGRTFIRRLIDLSCTVTDLSAVLVLDDDAQLDIQWWVDFVSTWNGRSIFHDVEWTRSPDINLFTDASDCGYGAYCDGLWFFGQWQASFAAEPIMVRELYPIAAACVVWGPSWKGKRLLFHCDNLAVVDTWKKGSCRNKRVMALIRLILSLAARFNFILYIQHIPGVDNSIADALSRLQMSRFRQLAPNATEKPVQVPLRDELN